MIREFGVRPVDNGFIVWWIEVDTQGEEFKDEKVFLTKSDASEFINDLILGLRQG